VDGKVVRGKDGWLFLDNDSNFVMSQYSGELRFSESELRRWRFVLETRTAWLQEHRVPYSFLVAPNAHSVYAEKLPDGYGNGEGRPIIQLMRYLRQTGSYARLMYPLDDLLRMKPEPVYTETETHWTELGAFVAYRHLMQQVRRTVDVPVLSEDEVNVRKITIPGDLGAKLTPPEASLTVRVDVRNPAAWLASDNRVFNRGRRIEYRCDAAPDVTCLLFGDSFAHMALPYFAESFRRLVFAHLPTLDYSLVEQDRPGVVVSILNERFLVSVPDDLSAATLEELACQKRAAGDMLAPRSMPGNRVDTAEQV
jgi:alginate O-acetyltransferase complex protein AlgJ